MKIKAVIFDKDGVIIDTKPIHYQVLSSFLKEYNFSVTEQEYNSYMVNSFQRQYISTIRENKEIKPIKNVDTLIKKLYDNKLKLAVASSANREKIELVLNRFELMKYFEALASGYEVNNSKPHPEIFLKAAEKLGVKPSECIDIEDSTNGIRAAKAAGMLCVGYNNPVSNQDLSEADIIINDFNDFHIESTVNES